MTIKNAAKTMTELTKPALSSERANTLWQPGQSGNPAGRPRQARQKLNDRFVTELAGDFDRNGRKAIVRLRENDVAAYIRVCASLLPKEVQVAPGPLDDLSDEELAALVHAAKKAVAKANGS